MVHIQTGSILNRSTD